MNIRSLFALCLLLFAAPVKGADEPDAAGLEFFEKQVRPLLVDHCSECHSNADPNGGLSLDSKASWLRGGDSGPAIVPSDPDKSRLIDAIRYKNLDLQMPPKSPLKPEEIAVLEKWVSMGAPDPRIEDPDSGPRPTGMSIEDGRQFWSMKKVVQPAVPTPAQAAWVRNPIDAFILARLEEKGVAPAPAADRINLIRRVTFDLTGLPPTPEEIHAFVNDETPDAFSKVVERLLASPQYGVRWGRHWLDVARYADSNGLDENLALGTAWRYRDYVIDAFNNNKPFNRFLEEQIAGDLLPDANQESKTATGFLVLGAKVLAEPDRDKLYMDTIDEQLDAMGKAFMGLTLGCARCHDHKFDPVKQADYYALAGILKSTKTFGDTNTGAIKHWHEHVFSTDEEKERLKAVDAEIAKNNSAAAKFKAEALAKVRSDARLKAAEYLMAAAKFEPGAPAQQVLEIAKSLELHPRILNYCRLHISYHPEDPLFEPWYRMKAAGDFEGIRAHYNELFIAANAALEAAKKADPKATTLKVPELEAARAALANNAGFLAIPSQLEFALDPATLQEYYKLAETARLLESSSPDATTALGVTDGTIVDSLPIHIRGSHRNLGEPVKRRFLEVLTPEGQTIELPADKSGRLELARWMSSPDHPLTSRVFVNRVWRWHFGKALVGTTENFGRLGDAPTHPELLDWLAAHFANNGWSIKDLHRLILSSSTYQMASRNEADEVLAEIDPENNLYAKFPIRRLEAEEIRDSVLAVSARLDSSLGGKSVPLRNRQFVFDHTSIDHTKYHSLRRAVYLPVIRNNVYPLFQQFDFPDPTMPTGNRGTTTVAPQALLLMNNDLILDSAQVFARTLLESATTDELRIQIAWQKALGREPSPQEVERSIAFLTDATASGRLNAAEITTEVREQAWSLLCQSLFACNEFLYVR